MSNKLKVQKMVPCDCPKGGMDDYGRVCQKCKGVEWVKEKSKLKVSKCANKKCQRPLGKGQKFCYNAHCEQFAPKKERKIKGWTLKSSLENSQSLKVWLDKCPDERYMEVTITYTP